MIGEKGREYIYCPSEAVGRLEINGWQSSQDRTEKQEESIDSHPTTELYCC